MSGRLVRTDFYEPIDFVINENLLNEILRLLEMDDTKITLTVDGAQDMDKTDLEATKIDLAQGACL